MIAEYLEVPAATCVYSPNASVAVDTVLRNIIYQPGEVIICFSSIYGSFSNTVQYLSQTTPVKVKQIYLEYPLSDGQVCQAFEEAIEEVQLAGNRPRLALFDTISSLPGVRVPFEQLTAICRNRNILSLIDGAHSVGHFPLEIPKLDPDFFTSNLHKWLHVPRGSAVLYVPLRNQHLLRCTLPTGFHFVPQPGTPNFVANFSSLGTLDDTPYLCTEAALEWRKKLVWKGLRGEDAIMAYTQTLAQEGGRAVADALGTEVLENEHGTLGQCSLTNIRLPLSDAEGVLKLSEIAAWVQRIMTFDHKTAVNVFIYKNGVWVRLSSQVYLTLSDFQTAGFNLRTVCERADRGEWRFSAGNVPN